MFLSVTLLGSEHAHTVLTSTYSLFRLPSALSLLILSLGSPIRSFSSFSRARRPASLSSGSPPLIQSLGLARAPSPYKASAVAGHSHLFTDAYDVAKYLCPFRSFAPMALPHAGLLIAPPPLWLVLVSRSYSVGSFGYNPAFQTCRSGHSVPPYVLAFARSFASFTSSQSFTTHSPLLVRGSRSLCST